MTARQALRLGRSFRINKFFKHKSLLKSLPTPVKYLSRFPAHTHIVFPEYPFLIVSTNPLTPITVARNPAWCMSSTWRWKCILMYAKSHSFTQQCVRNSRRVDCDTFSGITAERWKWHHAFRHGYSYIYEMWMYLIIYFLY